MLMSTAQIITEYYFDIAYDAIRSLNTLYYESSSKKYVQKKLF